LSLLSLQPLQEAAPCLVSHLGFTKSHCSYWLLGTTNYVIQDLEFLMGFLNDQLFWRIVKMVTFAIFSCYCVKFFLQLSYHIHLNSLYYWSIQHKKNFTAYLISSKFCFWNLICKNNVFVESCDYSTDSQVLFMQRTLHLGSITTNMYVTLSCIPYFRTGTVARITTTVILAKEWITT
jgi:hypothetical protein